MLSGSLGRLVALPPVPPGPTAVESRGGGAVVAVGTGDPEGAFTPVNLGTAAPGPPMAATSMPGGGAA